jgi:predicted MFS family arabinose efflux permease
VAAPQIQRELHAGFSDIQLVISGYVLAYAVGLATGGRLGDSLGRRRMFRAGLLAFTAFSAGCAAAPAVGVLIVLRVGQGLAAALMLPQVLSLIQVIFPGRERARALALYGATMGMGAVVGQLVGGALIQLDILGLGWRSVFLVNVPIGLAAAVGAGAVLPETRGRRTRLDVAGLVLGALAMTLLIYPLIRGSSGGWPRWVWPALAGSALALVALWYAEQRVAAAGRTPLVPPSMLRNHGFRTGLGTALAFYSGNYGLFLLLAYVFQEGLRLTPLGSGLAFLPLGIGFAGASLYSRQLVGRYGNAVLLFGAGTMAAGYVVLVLTLLPGPVPSGVLEAVVMAPALLLGGIGQGLVSAPLIGAILATVRAEDAGAGSALVLTVNQLASSLGVAVLGAVFVRLLGADPQASGARLNAADFTSALAGCSWVLLGLAVVTGLLAHRLPGSDAAGPGG